MDHGYKVSKALLDQLRDVWRAEQARILNPANNRGRWMNRTAPASGEVSSIRFTIDESVCADSYTERHLLVTVVAKSGGCSGAVPGADPYTGQVAISDPCGHMDGYTDAGLTGLCGTATYRYPVDGECEPQWELDALPAQDGCG